MIVTLKNLQQQTFTVEMEDTATVRQLKDKIHQDKGEDYPADNQRLIYAGKILADDHALSHYSIDPKKFIVVMVAKPKVEAAQTPAPVQATPTPAAAEEPAPSLSVATPVVPPTIPALTTATVPVTASTPAVVELDPEESAAHERRVEALLDMGYARPQVEQALRVSFDNQERAVEYLINGIPEELLMEQVEQLEAEAEGDDAPEDPLAFLRDQPQFQQMRAVIQQDPSLLHTILQQIGQTNPALLQAISQHQAAFVRMLNEPAAGGGGGTGTGTGVAVGVGSTGGGTTTATTGATTGSRAASGRPMLQISMQDKEAIERLKALGFPEHMVIQAYFACEKNENLAANFLLSMSLDD